MVIAAEISAATIAAIMFHGMPQLQMNLTRLNSGTAIVIKAVALSSAYLRTHKKALAEASALPNAGLVDP
jgi:hypothetical protein